MQLTAVIALLITCILLLFALALVITQRPSAPAVTRRDVAISQRMADVARLRKLRVDIETYGDFDTTSVCLLYDVCRALDFDQAQVQHVVGPAYWLVLDTPIGEALNQEHEDAE